MPLLMRVINERGGEGDGDEARELLSCWVGVVRKGGVVGSTGRSGWGKTG